MATDGQHEVRFFLKISQKPSADSKVQLVKVSLQSVVGFGVQKNQTQTQTESVTWALFYRLKKSQTCPTLVFLIVITVKVIDLRFNNLDPAS